MGLSISNENDVAAQTVSLSSTLLLSLRIPFLVLTPVCVGLGWAVAGRTHVTAELGMLNLILVLVGAITAHASVNWINEFIDFRSGLDRHTKRTPFSGGSGALLTAPRATSAVLHAGLVALAITLTVGVCLVARSGVGILPIGISGVLIITTYSTWIVRHPLACLLAPGVGFGPLMVVGTYRVLTGEFAMLPVCASLVPLFLSSNLLLLNQFPDRRVDEQFGRRHFPIIYGPRVSVAIYGLFVMATAAVICGGVGAKIFPPLCLIAMLPLVGGIVASIGAVKYPGTTYKFFPYLAWNAMMAVVTPFLLALALAIS